MRVQKILPPHILGGGEETMSTLPYYSNLPFYSGPKSTRFNPPEEKKLIEK